MKYAFRNAAAVIEAVQQEKDRRDAEKRTQLAQQKVDWLAVLPTTSDKANMFLKAVARSKTFQGKTKQISIFSE